MPFFQLLPFFSFLACSWLFHPIPEAPQSLINVFDCYLWWWSVVVPLWSVNCVGFPRCGCRWWWFNVLATRGEAWSCTPAFESTVTLVFVQCFTFIFYRSEDLFSDTDRKSRLARKILQACIVNITVWTSSGRSLYTLLLWTLGSGAGLPRNFD